MGRSSQQQAARNRQAIVAAASRLIRQKGVDGVGVREVMASAGLTQGGFGGQFGSKEALAAEACTFAFEAAEHAFTAASQGDGSGQAARLVEYYLSPKPPGQECPMATLAIDSSRSPADGLVRQAFTDGLGRLAGVVAGDRPSPERLALLAAMVGAAVLKSASNDEVLIAEIEAGVRGLSKSMT